MIPDPYKVLGVSPTASLEEITRAYRRLAKKYHPDVNHGDPQATRKMSEINAAYEQIKKGHAQRRQSPFGHGGSGEYTDSFGGFGPYGGSGQQRYEQSEFNPVLSYLYAGYYREALNVLAGISNRNAAWFYYSAIANAGLGNMITALEHAETAVRMEPHNREYRNLLNQIQFSGHMYQQQSQSYGMPVITLNRICLTLCLLRICCMPCGRFYC